MTRRIRILSLLVLILAASAAGAQEGFALPGLSGGQLTPADLAQGDTIVVVWASWSPRCRDLPGLVNPFVERFGGRAKVVTVNFQEDPGAAQQGSRGVRATGYLDRDGVFSKRYAITTLPGLVVFRGGQAVHQGKLDANASSILDGIFR